MNLTSDLQMSQLHHVERFLDDLFINPDFTHFISLSAVYIHFCDYRRNDLLILWFFLISWLVFLSFVAEAEAAASLLASTNIWSSSCCTKACRRTRECRETSWWYSSYNIFCLRWSCREKWNCDRIFYNITSWFICWSIKCQEIKVQLHQNLV